MAALSLVVAGLVSAGAAHSATWWLTTWGVIRGPYVTYRHEAIFGAVLAAAIVACAIGVIGLARSFSSNLGGNDAWFDALHREIARRGAKWSFAAIAGVQLCAIVGLEAVEQTIALGHTLGPAAALGAPLAAGLLIQLTSALATTLVLFRVVRAVVAAERSLRVFLAPFARRPRPSSAAPERLLARSAHDGISRLTPRSLRFANRPPPPIAA